MFFVYVLKSLDHYQFYVGMTQNVQRRVDEHNKGRTKSTKGWRPWVLFFFEEFADRAEARKREKYLKSGFGKQWIKNK